MGFLYNIGIILYSFAAKIASLFNKKAKQFIAGRRNWDSRLKEKIVPDSKYIWFHSASLGEFEQGRPVIESFKKQYPEYKILLTFFSPSGYEIRKNYKQADIICYLPLDTKKNARKFIQIVKPEKVFFIKYEYWYNYITEIKKNKIDLFVISANFRENQVFFKNSSLGRWYKNILFNFDHIFVQNKKSAELLKGINISNFTISGDTRFDRVADIAKGSKKLPIVQKFKGDKILAVCGSTWKPDEELIVEFINNNPMVKFIIAPHEVETSNINRIQQLLKNNAVLYSNYTEEKILEYQVLIIDCIGILSSVYNYGNIAYIGGGVGIHNILEAATFGLPIIFGPKYQKFQEAVELIKNGGAFSITNQSELNATLSSLLDKKTALKEASEICKNYIAKNVGSTQVIIKKVFNN